MTKPKLRKKNVICGICPAGCPVTVTFDAEGNIDIVEPDKSNNGITCLIGEHSRDIIYNDNRLKYPMKRTGPKGTYEFERISWDEAYDIITDNLIRTKKKYGPEATAIYTGRGSFELSLCDVYQPGSVEISSASSILFPFGSPNTLGVGALCYVSYAMIAPDVTFGSMYYKMYSDIENADMVVVWGSNPATDSPPSHFRQIESARARGAKIVVIDPRRTAVAKMDGAKWVPIRPGTDGALALGLCNVLIREDLYDSDFIENWTHGFDKFTRYAQQFRPEIVEDITGIPAETVRWLARELATTSGVAPVMYTGLEYTNSGVQNIRATFVLWAMAGQLDVPGGRCFMMPQNMFPKNRDGLVTNPDVSKALGRDRFPVYSSYRGESHAISLPESVLDGKPYKIRSLIIHGGSICTAWPQPEIWRKTLNELDFVVSIDRQLTADAAYADLVLPATTMYEINSYMTYGPMFRIRDKVIDPIGESRNDYFIMAELAERLGYGHLYPQTEEELLEYILKGSGFSPDDVRKNGGSVSVETVPMEYKKWEKGLLRKDGKPGFETPTGKFEIASTILEEHGYDSLPVFTDPTEGPTSDPDLAEEFPLIFNSGARVKTDFRSQHHGVESLAKIRPEPTVMINTKDAKLRNIENGEEVYIASPRGRVKMRAIVTDDIIEGCIDANMGGGGPVGPKAWQDCNINDLTDLQNYDPISGFPVYKALLCNIEKAVTTSDKLYLDSGEMSTETKSKKEKLPRVYLDNNATTQVLDEIRQAMIANIDNFGNPSSIYREGRSARQTVESARRSIARLLNTTAKRLIFTSGGSESNNYAIRGVAYYYYPIRNHLITSSIEHPSVLNTFRYLETRGFGVTYLEVDKYGMVNPDSLEKAITKDTSLVSIMLANNEIGTLQPIRELARIAHKRDVIFHCDAVQAIGKTPVDVENLGVDLMSISGHKLHAPKGIGALYIRKGLEIDPLITGGSQESSQRAGTENLPGIAAFGRAASLAIENMNKNSKIRDLRNFLQNSLLDIIPESFVNGHPDIRLPNTLNMTMPDIRGESLVLMMDKKGISLSSGSACKSGSPEPSLLIAIGLNEDQAHRSVRFSLGIENTEDEIRRTISTLEEILIKSKENIRYVSCR
ncbi:MAG: IscS subfamily cysteine desulfurase [Candidatus Kapaibacterium sp.]